MTFQITEAGDWDLKGPDYEMMATLSLRLNFSLEMVQFHSFGSVVSLESKMSRLGISQREINQGVGPVLCSFFRV